MSIQAILLPLFVQVALTLRAAVLDRPASASAAVRRGDVHARDIALREPNWPKQETQIANAYQQPVRIAGAVLCADHPRDHHPPRRLLFVVLAWVFVVLRVVHAYIHVTSNDVRLRFAASAAGAWCC